MELITPFEFVELFPEGRSLAIVGNAPSLMEARRGAWIDSHDVVVRFNECALDEYEEHVGRRTDVLVSNPYPEARRRPLLDGGRAAVLLIVTPQTRRGDRAVFEAWAGDHRVLFTYPPDLVTVENETHGGLMTGSYGIHLLTRLLRPSLVSCTGFTVFRPGDRGHYWQEGLPGGLKSHDLEVEARMFVRILNAVRTTVKVTPDIEEVSRRTGIPLGERIQVVP